MKRLKSLEKHILVKKLCRCNRIQTYFNYFVSYKFRESLIDKVADKLAFKFNVSDFYVSIKKLKEMYIGGNIIGSHTVSHPLMSKLSADEQVREINDSFSFLTNIDCIDIRTYCHPYGGFHSFNDVTISALNSNNIDFSFNVESRDIRKKILALQFSFYQDMIVIFFRLAKLLSYLFKPSLRIFNTKSLLPILS